MSSFQDFIRNKNPVLVLAVCFLLGFLAYYAARGLFSEAPHVTDSPRVSSATPPALTPPTIRKPSKKPVNITPEEQRKIKERCDAGASPTDCAKYAALILRPAWSMASTKAKNDALVYLDKSCSAGYGQGCYYGGLVALMNRGLTFDARHTTAEDTINRMRAICATSSVFWEKGCAVKDRQSCELTQACSRVKTLTAQAQAR